MEKWITEGTKQTKGTKFRAFRDQKLIQIISSKEVIFMSDEPKKDQSAEASAKPEESVDETKPEAKPESQKAQKETKGTEKISASGGKVSPKLAGIIAEVEKLSVLELAELVKALEDKFGVSAATPVAVAAAAAGGEAPTGATGADVGEKSEFDVVLTDSGANKIAVIKAVREIKPDLGLKEAKDLVDKGSAKLLESAKKEDAENAKKKLEEAGAQVELK